MLLPLGLFAQSGDYDAALDRYESITAECIRVKQSVASGEKVPPGRPVERVEDPAPGRFRSAYGCTTPTGGRHQADVF